MTKKRKSPKTSARLSGIGGRVCYDSWVREAGYQAHALVPAYDDLKELQKARWCRIATDIFEAMGGGHEEISRL